MIHYDVKNYTGETVSFLNVFEGQLLKKCQELSLKYALDVKLPIHLKESVDGKVYVINTNAGFSILNSLSYIQDIEAYLQKRINELNACISSAHTLFLEINFSAHEKTGDEPHSGADESNIQFLPIEGQYSFDQVILPDDLRKDIFDALGTIKHSDLVYNKWGYGEIEPNPKSILNFYGPPGTGKTMSAHAVAKELGKKLLLLNYADIESKYVGDAAKNLMKAFETAKQNDCVMFFDEADSFLGKRIENVSHGSDQALNSLRSQMLILLEEFSGVVLFATNLVTNFDKAFESRILKHIKFELPNEDARMYIIKGKIPSRLPLEKEFTEDDIRELSKACEGFSGREIKGAVLDTLLAKANSDGENAIFSFDDFKIAFDKKKQELDTLAEQETERKKEKIKKALEEEGMKNKMKKEQEEADSQSELESNDSSENCKNQEQTKL